MHSCFILFTFRLLKRRRRPNIAILRKNQETSTADLLDGNQTGILTTSSKKNQETSTEDLLGINDNYKEMKLLTLSRMNEEKQTSENLSKSATGKTSIFTIVAQ